MQANIERMDEQQLLPYSTGNYIQYPMIKHNGKEYEKGYESLGCTVEIDTTL